MEAAAAVLVRVSGPDARGLKSVGRSFFSTEGGRTTLSSSGVVCRSRAARSGLCVVTSAYILAPFIRVEDDGIPSVEDRLVEACTIHILMETGVWLECKSVRIARLKNVLRAAEQLTGSRAKRQRGIHVGCVALLEIVEEDAAEQLLGVPELHAVMNGVKRGDGVMVMSSAFGLVSPTVFQNSLTTGVVSNIVHWPSTAEDPCIYLTDARCLAGSEGAPVYNEDGQFLGIVAPAFFRGDMSHVELNAIIHVAQFAEDLELDLGGFPGAENEKIFVQQTAGTSMPLRHKESHIEGIDIGLMKSKFGLMMFPRSVEHAVAQAACSVVLVRVNTSWGSGILISEDGIIITCAHLFKTFTIRNTRSGRLEMRKISTRILVTFRDHEKTTFPAELVFCAKGPIDVALLRIRGQPNLFPKPVELPQDVTNFAFAGQKCVALGHAIFNPNVGLQATITAGNVAKVIPHPRDHRFPAILQTCASVFRGHSGGMLGDEEGRFLGILTSNARHSNGSIIPTINFAIPFSMVRPLMDVIHKDEETQNAVFDAYDLRDPELVSLWHLEAGPSPPQPKPKPSRYEEFLREFKRSKL